MIVAQHLPRRQSSFYQPSYPQNPRSIPQSDQHNQHWTPPPSIVSTPPQQLFEDSNLIPTNNLYSFGATPDLFDFQPQQYPSSPSQSVMQSEQSNGSWLSSGQLTPISSKRAQHYRESSLSSLGSAGPASPYTANTSNPQVAGDVYHDFHDYQQASSKPMTPTHTPSQDNYLLPHYSNYYQNSQNLAFSMGSDGIPKQMADAVLMPAPEFNNQSARPLLATVATHESPATPPSYDEERQKNAYRNTIPKLDRTMSDIYADELYNPSFQITTAPAVPSPISATTLSSQNDIFAQRLQAASSQHLSASVGQAPLVMPSRERSPFRQGSPLAPSANSFGSQQSPNLRFGTATHMREQQKAENDARALQQQLQKTSPVQATSRTISPKDVDLVFHENEEESGMPLFPQREQRQAPMYQLQQAMSHDQSELDDAASQHSFGSMATSRRESSSAYSNASQATQQQSNFNFVPPAVPGTIRQIPQQYPFVHQARRQPSNMTTVTEDFPATLTSMESSSSEYVPEAVNVKKPARSTADSGTYTCTYHGCTLRFESPAKLQKHKREGHRNSASSIGGGEEGMTSAARNSQAGPHRCDRINPSTGKSCNTIFSRPYDLTRHEDTIHNARKQKVRCPICTEEKTFSRSDALTRHFRVCHPDVDFPGKTRRRGGS